MSLRMVVSALVPFELSGAALLGQYGPYFGSKISDVVSKRGLYSELC